MKIISIYICSLSCLVFAFPLFAAKTPCVSGEAAGFQCLNVDLESRVDLKTSGIEAESGNDIWGWTDPETGREFALMGMSSKTSFVDITDPQNPIHVGDLRAHTDPSLWRDIKVYQNYAFIVSEANRHGMQVFDLTKLRRSSGEPIQFEASAHYNEFGSAHNIAINEASGTAYVVGSNTCDAGMRVIDIRKPLEPTFLTCVDKGIFDPVGLGASGAVSMGAFHGEDYTHDVQCVQYDGPDERYQGHEICVASNADTVNIVDMTDKANPVQISVKNYNGLGYVHQGWLTEDHRYFLLGDELDEMRFGHPTKTLIWDVSDLETPKLSGAYFHTTNSIDHNMYVKDNYLYQANYQAGLRVLSLENISEGKLQEVAFFDTMPETDTAEFAGTWSVYPYFKSGNVVLSNIEGFLFVVRPTF